MIPFVTLQASSFDLEMASLVEGTRNTGLPITSNSFEKLEKDFKSFSEKYPQEINNDPRIAQQLNGLKNIVKVNRHFSECFGDFIGSRDLRTRIHEIMMKNIAIKPGCENIVPFDNIEVDQLTSTLLLLLRPKN